MSSTEMKSYLSLIPISAKVRRRQNRMTILCIVLAVFLVTAVFSMADMEMCIRDSQWADLCIQETGLCTGESPDAGRSRGAVVRQKI